jgi:hypothetical protein
MAIAKQYTENALAQEKFKQFQDTRNALAQYQETKDLGPVMAADPATAGQITDLEAKRWGNAWTQIRTLGSLDPAMAPQYKEHLLSAGVPPHLLQPFDNVKTEDDMRKVFYQYDIAHAAMKAREKGIASLGSGGGVDLITGKTIPPGAAPTTILDRMGRRIAEVPGKAIQLHEGPTPQWFADPDNPLVGQFIKPEVGASPPLNAAGKPYIPKTSVNQAGIESLSEDALRTQVDKAIQTGVDPSLGFGGGLRSKYFEMFNTRVKELGLNAGDIGTQKAVQASLRSALSGLEGQAAKINAFASNFDKNIEVAEKLLEKNDPRTGVPIANKWIQAGKRSITGDADIAALDVAVKTVANEFARLTTSATGGGQLAEEEIKKAEKLLAAAQSPEQMKAALSVMKADRHNRERSFNEQTQNLKERLRQPAGGASQGPAGTQNVPGGSSYKRDTLPPASSVRKGTRGTDDTTGNVYMSDGANWVLQGK